MTTFLTTPQGRHIAYHQTQGKGPGVVFLGGFRSDMSGSKAQSLQAWAEANGRAFLRFDYSGHGASHGPFVDGAITDWREDAAAVIDVLTEGPQILVGSSMGGWIMLVLGLARPEGLRGLVGIAGAPDFTETLATHGLDDGQRQQLAASGYCDLPNCYDDGEPYRISQHLLDEGREHLLLGGQIDIDLPVRLIQGQRDADVPWQHALTIAAQLRSDDVEVQLLKCGDHRLSAPADLARLVATVDALLSSLS